MTATAHIPHVQGCCNRSLCWSATAPCRETPWDRLPELSVAGGTLLGQVAPQVAARTSLSRMGQLATPPGSPGQFSRAWASCTSECAVCRVPADQVCGHCGAEGQGKPWRWRMAVSPSWARALGSEIFRAGAPCPRGQGSRRPEAPWRRAPALPAELASECVGMKGP